MFFIAKCYHSAVVRKNICRSNVVAAIPFDKLEPHLNHTVIGDFVITSHRNNSNNRT